MTGHAISDPEYAAALVAGRQAARTEFRACSVAYLPECDAVQVMTAGSGGFVIPRSLIGALHGAGPADLARMQLWPGGSLIEIDHLDIHIAVDGMIRAALPVLVPPGTFGNGERAAGLSRAARQPRRTAA